MMPLDVTKILSCSVKSWPAFIVICQLVLLVCWNLFDVLRHTSKDVVVFARAFHQRSSIGGDSDENSHQKPLHVAVKYLESLTPEKAEQYEMQTLCIMYLTMGDVVYLPAGVLICEKAVNQDVSIGMRATSLLVTKHTEQQLAICAHHFQGKLANTIMNDTPTPTCFTCLIFLIGVFTSLNFESGIL